MSKEKEPNVRPLGARCLIRCVEPLDRIGNILLPDTAKEKPTKGEILRIGAGCDLPKEQLVGHVAIFQSYSGVPVPGSKHLLIMREEDLLGIEE